MAEKRTVDEWVAGLSTWSEEASQLVSILREMPLQETLKWGIPYYVHQSKNIVGVCAFKSYFGLWFQQGALLKDEGRHLTNAQEGTTRALRQWRMISKTEIKADLIQSYVEEACFVIESGKDIKPNKSKPLIIPPELEAELNDDTDMKKAFDKLGLGARRDYADYVASAKRDDTKSKRLVKIVPMIKSGKTLYDKYKK